MRASTHFQELEQDSPDSGAELVYRRMLPESAFDVRLEVASRSRHWRFVVGGTKAPSSHAPAEMRGLIVSIDPTSGQLVVELADDRLKDLFTALVEDLVSVISKLDTNKAAVPATLERLALWRRLFSDLIESGLSPEQQRGLFAELQCLRGIAIPATDPLTAVEAWTGPFESAQDFRTDKAAIEVKSRLRKGDTTVRISSESQLDPSDKPLFLAVYSLDAGRGISLNDMVEAAHDSLAGSMAAQVGFADALLRYGYLEIHPQRYDQPRYTELPSFFEVSGRFPRIHPDQLDHGILRVSYDLELTDCVPFEVSAEALIDALRGNHAGP